MRLLSSASPLLVAATLGWALVPAVGFGLGNGRACASPRSPSMRATFVPLRWGASLNQRSPLKAVADDNEVGGGGPALVAGKTLAGFGVAGGLAVVFWKRVALLAVLATLRDEWLLAALDKLRAAGVAGLVTYAILFLLWEMTLGITTPVETAAGMAFGIKGGILASGAGKILGCWLTFVLARYAFADAVREKVKDNELLGLMEESIRETPLKVALLCRFSPLPELVKNAGMGVMPVPNAAFLTSILLHGFSFTCLWTCMGAETARVLRGLPPSRALKLLLTGATWIGFGAPVLIGLWIKSLKDKQKARHSEVPTEAPQTE